MSNSKWLWQTLEHSPERLTEQEKEQLDLLVLDPRVEALRRYLEVQMWQQVSQMVSSQGSDQARWQAQGFYDALRMVALRLEKE